MGDRANVHVVDGKGSGVYLYTHWGGNELPLVVKAALVKQWRWNDAPYLTRIIFDEMTAGEQGKEIGFGISTSLYDNSHPIIQVNCIEGRVSFILEGSWTILRTWPFREFITTPDDYILEVYRRNE